MEALLNPRDSNSSVKENVTVVWPVLLLISGSLEVEFIEEMEEI